MAMFGRVSDGRLPPTVPYLFLYNVVNTYYYASATTLVLPYTLNCELDCTLALPSAV